MWPLFVLLWCITCAGSWKAETVDALWYVWLVQRRFYVTSNWDQAEKSHGWERRSCFLDLHTIHTIVFQSIHSDQYHMKCSHHFQHFCKQKCWIQNDTWLKWNWWPTLMVMHNINYFFQVVQYISLWRTGVSFALSLFFKGGGGQTMYV